MDIIGEYFRYISAKKSEHFFFEMESFFFVEYLIIFKEIGTKNLIFWNVEEEEYMKV